VDPTNTGTRPQRGGGVAVVYRSTLLGRKLTLPPIFTTFEYVLVDLSRQAHHLLIISLYRSSSNPLSSKFLDDIKTLFEHLAMYSCPVIVLGDFNIHTECVQNAQTTQFLATLEHFDFKQLVHSPTHRLGGTLDLVITQSNSKVKILDVREHLLSDHFVVYGTMARSAPTPRCVEPQEQRFRTVRAWKHFNILCFRDALRSSALCDDPSLLYEELTLDDMFTMYNSVVTQLLDQYAPFIKIRIRRTNSSPWFDNDCSNMKREVRRAERRYRKSKDTSHHQQLRNVQMKLFQLYRLKENAYWSKTISEAGNSATKRWNCINRMLCKSASGNDFHHGIMPDQFLDFFSNKIEQVRCNTANSGSPTFADYCGPKFAQFTDVLEQDIRRHIATMPCKQCPLDPAPTWLIKECADLLAPFITIIINKSLREGYVPPSQKVAIIRPRLKKQGLDVSLPSNYRPISNLTFLSKLLERVVDVQLSNFLADTKALPLRQSAYRKYHSTETALLKVHSDICSSIDNGNAVLLGLLDLSSAFDTVDYDILLMRLRRSYGIVGVVHAWITSYLQDRTCYVLVNEQISRTITLVCGVPQGSVLGPKLWLLYIGELDNLIAGEGFNYHGYADDTQIYNHCATSAEGTVSLSNQFAVCVTKLLNWMKSNRLQLNPDKTECIWIRSPHCQFNSFPDLAVGSTIIHPVATAKSLGVCFDQFLTFERHLLTLSKVCHFQLRQLKPICKRLDHNTNQMLLQAFISSRLDYCNALYSGLPATRLKILQRIQNNAARIYSSKRKSEHISPVLRELHWLPVADRIRFKTGVLVYKALHNQLPEYLSDFCVLAGQFHDHALRSVTHSDLAKVRTATKSIGDRTFQVTAAGIWNDIPASIRNSESVAVFCRQLKTLLFIQAYGFTS